ncbi:unnamed protein product [Musa acuminata var. zebrina]
MTTTTTSAAAKGCGGDGCNALHPWPLHHVRHRGGIRRLCTSCVLKCHNGSFCSSCFSVLDAGPSRPTPTPRPAVVRCSKCPSVCHLTCLQNPNLASQYLCPCCSNPDGFSYFLVSTSADAGGVAIEGSVAPCEEKRKTIDLNSAKVLFAAARLAVASMSRAAAAARVEAERKVKEAMVARKRAREMLERALLISKKERERIKELIGSGDKAMVASLEVINPKKKKKKAPKPEGPSVMSITAAHKRVQAHGIAENRKSKSTSVSSVQSSVAVDMKNSAVRTVRNQSNYVEQEENKALRFGSKSGSVKED